jgi:hypothetical protein
MTLEEAMSNALPIVTAAGERLARLTELGTIVGERQAARAEGAEGSRKASVA